MDTEFDIRSFGAKADGSDATAAIQKAVDAAAECGGTVQVPPGTFCAAEVRLRPHTGICGVANWSYRAMGGSILKLNRPGARCLLDLTGALGASVTTLCLDGGKLGEGVHGLMIDKPDFGKEEDAPHIDGCRISNFTGDGVHLGRIWCFSVRHCMISHNLGNGLFVRGWDGFILDNWLSGNAGAGFGAYDENSSNTLTGNRIEWNVRGGIIIQAGNQYNICGNYIDRSGGPGITLLPRAGDRSRHISIAGNVIYRSGRPDWRKLDERESAQMRIENALGVSVCGNSLNAGRDDGGKGHFSPEYGIIYGGLEACVIKDNVMHAAALKALLWDLGGHGPGVIVKDNVGNLAAR